MKLQFRHIYDFDPRPFKEGDETLILVECPNCGKCADLIFRFKNSTLSCKCGYLIENVDRKKCKYWLSKPCCGHTLYAINEEHLTFLEKYISSESDHRISAIRRKLKFLQSIF